MTGKNHGLKCKAPKWIDGQFVSCGLCSVCRKRRINDLVGKCLAEAQSADQVLCLDLTYADNQDARSATLSYGDVQRFLKRLRIGIEREPERYSAAPGAAVRYLVSGEYGSLRGRAHWHLVLFFHGCLYPVPRVCERVHIPEWTEDGEPIGFAWFDEPSWQRFHYVCKYVVKQRGQADSLVRQSTGQVLGLAYFEKMADLYVEQGIAPRSFNYAFPDNKGPNGVPWNFTMRGTSRARFIERYLTTWARLRPDQDLPSSELVEEMEQQMSSGSTARYLAESAYKSIYAKASASWKKDHSSVYVPGAVAVISDKGARVWIKTEFQAWELVQRDMKGEVVWLRDATAEESLELDQLLDLGVDEVRPGKRDGNASWRS